MMDICAEAVNQGENHHAGRFRYFYECEERKARKAIICLRRSYDYSLKSGGSSQVQRRILKKNQGYLRYVWFISQYPSVTDHYCLFCLCTELHCILVGKDTLLPPILGALDTPSRSCCGRLNWTAPVFERLVCFLDRCTFDGENLTESKRSLLSIIAEGDFLPAI